MKRKVDEKTVEHISRLSYIKVEDHEIQKYIDNLSKILDFFDQINSVNTENIEPLFHPITSGRSREDNAEDSLPKEEALRNAPSRESDYIKGPKVGGE